MKSKSFILLKALLKSTSSINTYKYCNDSKKRGKIIGGNVGIAVVYLMLMAYFILTCYGYGQLGMADAIPAFNALILAALSFMFTLFKTNGYLFGFKEYDMLMAMPFPVKSVAGCKFVYMYVKSLPWYASVNLSMLIGYCIFAKPSLLVIPLWLVLGAFLPVIPMLLAAFLGFIFAKIGTFFKAGGKIIQAILVFALVIFSFALRFIIESVAKTEGATTELLNSTSEITDSVGSVFLPVKWFSDAIVKFDVISMLLLVVTSIVLFEIIFLIVGKFYRQINSALMTGAAAKKYTFKAQKKSSVVNGIAFKEFKRMLGNTTYLTNAAIGEVLGFIVGVASLFVGLDKLLAIITQGAPVTNKMMIPALPIVIYFCVGMVATTAMTPSLEGKNYWIMQSLPIEKSTLIKGKMLFNIYLSVPVGVFSTLCLCISAKASAVETLVAVLCVVSLCLMSTTWGSVCGIKHMKLEWENEIEVVKQGAAVSIYLLPNMFGTMILVVGAVALGLVLGPILVMLIVTAAALLLAVLCYRASIKAAKKM